MPPAIRISDDFGARAVDPQLWYVFTTGVGETVSEANGSVEMAIRADAVPGGDFNQISGQIGTHCHFSGDFDAHVDYRLLAWPDENGALVQLMAFLDSGPAGVWRQSHEGEAYAASVPPTGAVVPNRDARGRLRVSRVRGVMSTYYFRAGKWRLLTRGPMPGTANLALQVFSPARDFAHTEVSAAFDNFVVTGRGPTSTACPAA